MRIKVIVSLRHDSGVITSEMLKFSRSSTLHLIKTAIEKYDSSYFSRYLKNNDTKPFTFALYFPFEKKNGTVILTKPFSLTVSSNDPNFIFVLYNSLLKLNESNGNRLSFCNCHWKLISVFPLPNKEIGDTFRTLVPALIRIGDKKNKEEPSSSDKNESKFLVPSEFYNQWVGASDKHTHMKPCGEEDIRKALEKNIRYLSKYFLSMDGENISVTSLKITGAKRISHGSGNSEHPYTMTYPGLMFSFKISAPEKVRKLIYDIGVGAKRSEGFGMLDVC